MKNNAIKWLYSVPGRKKLYILALIVLQTIHGASSVWYALLLRNIVDRATAHDRAGFRQAVLLIVLLVAGQIAVRAAIRRMTELSKATFENLFKMRLTENILHRDFASVNAVHSGEWLNRLTSDTVIIADGYVDILPGLAGTVVKMTSAAVMLVILDWHFGAVFLPFGVLMIFMTYLFRKALKKLHKNVQEKDGKLRIFLQERIGSMVMIRSYAAEEQTECEAQKRMDAHRAARMKRNRFSNFCNIGFSAGISGMYLFGMCYCGYGILLGTVTYGTLTAVTQLIAQIQAPFANITGYLPKFYAMTASAERLMEAEQFERDSEKPALTAGEIRAYYDSKMISFGLHDAGFTYYPAVNSIKELSKENQPTVLENVSVDIRKGDYVAFTGHSGCGKSTVLKLLMSIYRLDSGTRYLNGTDGESVLSAEWRRMFAYVPQGNQLMSGTIREVIAFADSAAAGDDAKIGRALKIACADTFVSELENGVDTLLGERGTGLSEGQMQRIAVARAIFSESPVLLLDESTSALDERTERQLLENLRNMTDRTVVIVTHRPAALEICNRILEFTEDGVIEKRGENAE